MKQKKVQKVKRKKTSRRRRKWYNLITTYCCVSRYANKPRFAGFVGFNKNSSKWKVFIPQNENFVRIKKPPLRVEFCLVLNRCITKVFDPNNTSDKFHFKWSSTIVIWTEFNCAVCIDMYRTNIWNIVRRCLW